MYGIDFGTSNTVVTTQDGTAATSRLLQLGGSPIIPSLLYFEKDQLPSIGFAAMDAYSDALQRHHGKLALEKSFRFFQAVKLALKDPNFTGTRIFGQFWPAESLAGLFLKEVKRQADQETGRNESAVVLGRPVVLGATAEEDSRIQNRFRKAAEFADFSDIHFVMEPVGALVSAAVPEGNTLIFDFGGGTLDISLAAAAPGNLRILANDGIDLGGYIINEQLSRQRIISHFGFYGKFRTMTGRWLDMPKWITDQVASFYALPLAELAKTRSAIKDLIPEARPADKPKLKGLLEFLDRNLSFSLFNTIDEAKIQLSDSNSASISFQVEPYIQIAESIERAWFDHMLTPPLQAAEVLITRVLNTAGVPAESVSHVVRVGGSSRIPAFITLLERLFPGRVNEGDVFTSIASGLLEAHRLGLSM
ncbi:MAG: Hsp70 family protein [Spirochaetes bacterium]|nr:Hsp70 family protein [Spirochaetota bacterium]